MAAEKDAALAVRRVVVLSRLALAAPRWRLGRRSAGERARQLARVEGIEALAECTGEANVRPAPGPVAEAVRGFAAARGLAPAQLAVFLRAIWLVSFDVAFGHETIRIDVVDEEDVRAKLDELPFHEYVAWHLNELATAHAVDYLELLLKAVRERQFPLDANPRTSSLLSADGSQVSARRQSSSGLLSRFLPQRMLTA